MYSSLREQLLASEPLPSIDVAYQAVVNSERLKLGDGVVASQTQDNVMAFKVQSDQRPYNNMYDPNKFCKHCSREGHSQEGCFQLIGYPEWWGDRQRSGRGYGRGGRTGGRAGGRGRAGAGFVNNRGGRGQDNIHAHNLSISAETTSHPATGSSGDASGLTGVTASQVQQVLEYLNSRKISSQLQGPVDEGGDWSG